MTKPRPRCKRKVFDGITRRSFPCGNPQRKDGEECNQHRRLELARELQRKQHAENMRLWIQQNIRACTDADLLEEVKRRKLVIEAVRVS